MKWILFLLFISLESATAQSANTGKSWAQSNTDSIYKGTPYVPFEVTMLDGKTITNNSCIGKVTFIDFWFEGCVGCREEIGQLNELYDSLKDNPSYQFISVTFDAPESLPEFIKKYGLRYPIATVPGQEEAHRLNYHQAFPTKVIIDRQGKIALIGMRSFASKSDRYEISVKKVLSIMKHAD